MKLFQFILCGLMYQASYQAAIKERILSGNVVGNGRYPFPYQVELSMKTTLGIIPGCAGSLISKIHVLTAQHCLVHDAKLLAVAMAFGSKESKSLQLIQSLKQGSPVDKNIQVCEDCWILHDDYMRYGNYWADIAIINLPQEVQFSNNIHAIRLPFWSDKKLDLAGRTSVVAGWGRTKYSERSDILLFAHVKIDTKFDCSSYFNVPVSDICSIRNFNNPNHQMTCKGDSGGPVVIDNKQVGIVSYGHAIDGISFQDCRTDAFDAYTDVSYFLEWISQNTGIPIIY